MLKRLILTVAMLAQNAFALDSVLISKNRDIELNRLIRGEQPTLWLSADKLTRVTTDSVGRISALASNYGSISFTQGTDANKPILSRSDQVENLIAYSGDFTNAVWDITTRPVTFSAPTITASATANMHYLQGTSGSRQLAVAGMVYRAIFDVEYGNHPYIMLLEGGDAAFHGVSINLSNNTVHQTINASNVAITTVSGSRKTVAFDFTRTNGGAGSFLNPIIAFADTSARTSPPSYTPAGTETVKAYSIQIQRSSMQPSYVATTTAPVHGGVVGRRSLTFDGSNDRMTSVSALSAILAAGAVDGFLVFTTNTPAVYQTTLTDTGTMIGPDIDDIASTFIWYNWDGPGYDAADTAVTLAAQRPYVAAFRHSGGNIYASVNNSVEVSAASGDTTTLTGTLLLGYEGVGSYFNGHILEVITFNRTLPVAVREQIIQGLREKWGA